jgi:hypothetical protein
MVFIDHMGILFFMNLKEIIMGGKIVEGLERLTSEQYWFLVGWLKNILPSGADFYIPPST